MIKKVLIANRGEIAIRLKIIRLKPGYWIILDEEKVRVYDSLFN